VLSIETKTLYRDDIKTGDVLLVDWQRFKNVLLSSFLRSSFMHPCIAVWENNDLFIVEIINYFNDEEYKGLIKVPFNKWHRINKRGLILHNKLDIIGKKEDQDKTREILKDNILNFYNKYKKDIKEPVGLSYKWKRFLNPEPKYRKLTKFDDRVCTEITAMILIECGVVKANKSVESYNPDSFLGMKEFDTNKPYEYNESYLAKIDEA
tara:strand:- start:42 stop:665 length:624 start_codon:yes stop_codon:yes gene_type:complete